MNDQHSRPPTRMCIMCGTTEGLLNHHVNYCTDDGTEPDDA